MTTIHQQSKETSMATITTKRYGTQMRILANGEHVGDAFKFTKSKGYGLRLKSVYWVKGQPNTRGGFTVEGFPRMKDAIKKACEYFNQNATVLVTA